MKRHRVAFLTAALCLVLLTNCGASSPTSDTSQEPTAAEQAKEIGLFDMEYVDRDQCFALYRDTLTDILYITYTDNSGYAGQGGLSILYNTNGLPMTCTEYLTLGKQRANITTGDNAE